MVVVPDKDELGKLYPIFLVGYDSNWPTLFRQEKERLIGTLGRDTVLRIEHIGSTAIPDMKAKPTIDILIELPASDRIERIHEIMIVNGYIRMVE